MGIVLLMAKRSYVLTLSETVYISYSYCYLSDILQVRDKLLAPNFTTFGRHSKLEKVQAHYYHVTYNF